MKQRIFCCLAIVLLQHVGAMPVPAAAPATLPAADRRSLSLKGDGVSDDTDALQQTLSSGQSDIYLRDGTYLIGTVRIPADTRLRFAPRAFVRALPERTESVTPMPPAKKPAKSLLIVTGDRVTIDGLQVDFTLPGNGDQLIDDRHVQFFVYAKGVSDLRISGARLLKPERRELIPLRDRKRQGRYSGNLFGELLHAEECRDVVLEDSRAASIAHMIYTAFCQDVTVRGNRMDTGNTITTFAFGSQWLKHYGNWSRDCSYQVVWRGGSPDPSRKAPVVPLGSSSVVKRGSKPGDEGFNIHTSGVFDVMVENNYAEYGNTLAWGNKGRQVLINGNIARFISDYAYGTEGGENVVFSNNISVNSTAGAFVSMYWGEKLLISGNLAITRDDDSWNPELSWFPEQRSYHGGFVRLHHGPANQEDAAAGSKYGAGQVTISGNLFVNELNGIPKGIEVESGGDVYISGNKLTNGRVNKNGTGRLTVANNEFTWDFADEFPCVSAGSDVGELCIRGNTMRRTPDVKRRAGEDEVNFAGPGLASTPEEPTSTTDSNAPRAQTAAIMCNRTVDGRTEIADNTMEGWPRAMELSNRGRNLTPACIISGNRLDGTIRCYGSWKRAIRDNLNLGTLQEVTPAAAQP